VGLVVRRADDPEIMVGSGRPGGFVIELGDRAPLEGDELAMLIAHENLHRYIGIWLKFAPGGERATLWFGEGVVQYLSAQAVVRSGLSTPELLLDALSDALGGYLLNECADGACQGEGDEAFWRFPSLRQSSYHRGFLLAFWLDIELRRGSHRLVGVVRDLLRTHAGRRGISNEDIRLALERQLGRDLGDWYETYVVQSRRLPWQEWLDEAGLRARRVLAEEPAPGVGPRTSPRWVVVRVGPGFDRLMGWPVGAEGPFE